MFGFFKKAFADMKESTKAQHQVTKAEFNAVRAESRATFEEAKLSPAGRQALMQKERDAQIAAANKRRGEAEARIEAAKNSK